MIKVYGENLNYNNNNNNNNNDMNDKQVIVCDINPEMLAVGRDRLKNNNDLKDYKNLV